SNVSRFIKSTQDAAGQMREAWGSSGNLHDLAKLWAEAGDIGAALKTADLYPDPSWRSGTQAVIAEVQAKSGDAAGAHKTFAATQAAAAVIQGDHAKGHGIEN